MAKGVVPVNIVVIRDGLAWRYDGKALVTLTPGECADAIERLQKLAQPPTAALAEAYAEIERLKAALRGFLPANHPAAQATEPPVQRKPMLSDRADELIRELHQQGLVTMRSVFDGAILTILPDRPAMEPASREIRTIDDVAAICHAVTGLCCHILGSPSGPCTINNCAAVRGYLGGPEFAEPASREASMAPAPPPAMYVHECPHFIGRTSVENYQCPKCNAERTKPFQENKPLTEDQIKGVTSMNILSRKVTVCDKCLQVSCLAGEFMCEEAKGAGTTEISIDKLRTCGYENPEWWFRDPGTGVINQAELAEYKLAAEAMGNKTPVLRRAER